MFSYIYLNYKLIDPTWSKGPACYQTQCGCYSFGLTEAFSCLCQVRVHSMGNIYSALSPLEDRECETITGVIVTRIDTSWVRAFIHA